MSETDLADVECFHGIVYYGKLKTSADILNYIRQFCDVKIIFEKKALEHLYICSHDPRIQPTRGERHE